MSARLQHLMTTAEQVANQKRETFYNLALWFVVGLSLLAAFIVFGLVVATHAYDKGVSSEQLRQANLPKPAPANCKEWLRHCSAETLEAWKKPWRKPT